MGTFLCVFFCNQNWYLLLKKKVVDNFLFDSPSLVIENSAND